MLNWLSSIHRANTGLWFSDSVQVERHAIGSDSWQVIASSVPCQVQSPRASSSSSDEDVATIEEKSAIWVYVPDGTDIEPGDRVVWSGRPWEVNSVVGQRTGAYALRVECSVSQSALLPEMIRFRRRRDGEWVELGTFPMRFTRQSPALPQLGGEESAIGATIRSAMIGDDTSVVLEVGDWFGRDGFPGRVLEKDAGEPGHIEFRYEMETAVP